LPKIALFFLKKVVKIAALLRAPPLNLHMAVGVRSSAPDSCLLLHYAITTFYKATVLALKLFIIVEKE